MRINWNGYIEEQLHWAERLSNLAQETGADQAEEIKGYAKRASMNARAATNEQISQFS